MSENMSRAEQMRARSRIEVTCASGQTYVIRRINAQGFIDREVFPPGVFYGSEAERSAQVDALGLDQPEAIDRMLRATLRAGLVDPPLWDGEEHTCPDTHVTLASVPAGDTYELFDRIMSEAGLSVTLVRGAAFREGESAAGTPDRPHRDQARPARARRGSA